MNTSEHEIQELKSRVALLERRVAALEGKRYVPNESPIAATHSIIDDILDAVTAPPPIPHATGHTSLQSDPGHPSTTHRQPRESFLERNVGKYVMGIAASVLVLLSLVGFAQFITPHLTALAKLIIMYVASAVFATVGLLRMWEDGKYKALFTALAACGVSAVYVTSLVGHFAFDIIGTWALVAILMAWIVCLIPLSCKGGKTFAIICNAGIVIASMLCAFNWSSTIAGIAVYVPCLIALYCAVHTSTFKGDWLLLVQLPIVCVVLLVLGEFRTDTNTVACITSFAVVYVAFLLAQLHYKDDNKHVTLLFYHGIATLAALILSTSMLIVDTVVIWDNVVCFIALASLLVVLYRKHRAQSSVIFYLLFFPYVIYMSTLSYNDTFSQHIGHLAPSALLLMAIGVRFKELPMRLSAVFYVILWCIFALPTWEHVIIVITASLLLLVHTIKHYHFADKYSFTVILVAGVLVLAKHNMIDLSITYALLGVLGIVLCTSLFRNNMVTRKSEVESVIISYASTFILLSAGVSILFKQHLGILTIARHTLVGTESVALGLVILTTTALSIANLRKSYAITGVDERFTSWYNGIKLSIVLLAILHSLHAVNFVISITGLVLAVVFIVIGFKFLLKGCRLYGLVVSLLCVIKLAMFDIHYDSSIMRPMGLLISGLLCFGISWIYSRLERKIK